MRTTGKLAAPSLALAAFVLAPPLSAQGITAIIDASGDGLGNDLEGAQGMAVDPAGNVYVSGYNSYNVFKITPAGVITEIIDETGDGAGHPFEWPEGIAVDGAGNVFATTFDGAFRIDAPPMTGFGYCFGDPGVDTPCPCGNDNDGSVPGSGCDHGAFTSGARLYGTGGANVSADTFVLRVPHQEPLGAGLFFQGESAANGGQGTVFGDGLRCANLGVIRLQVHFADAEGSSLTTIPIATAGGVSAGDVKYYQLWLRTVLNPPCGLGVNDFNATNGYEVYWMP